MQIFDFSPTAGQAPTQGAFKRLGLVFKYGSDWTAEMEAQRELMDLLGKYLDDRYCLLRNLTLPDLDVPIPFVLIGPPGVQMIYVTPVKGIYRARGDLWFVVDTRRRFRPAAPNLIIRSNLMARAIQVYLEKHDIPAVKVEPILVSTSAGLYVEAIRPTVRIVMSDAVDRMIASLQQGPLVLTRPDVEKMVGALTERRPVGEAAPAVSPGPTPEPFVPEPVSAEAPSWMEDRMAALDAGTEEEPEENVEAEATADAQVAAQARAEWVTEDITGEAEVDETRQQVAEPPPGERSAGQVSEAAPWENSPPPSVEDTSPITIKPAAVEKIAPAAEPSYIEETTPSAAWPAALEETAPGASPPVAFKEPVPAASTPYEDEESPIDVLTRSSGGDALPEEAFTREQILSPDNEPAVPAGPRSSLFTRQQWTVLVTLMVLILLVVVAFVVLLVTSR